jgi:L-ascorbate metabolism protein UlaG (beta-lactamase superfamily)
MKITHFSNSFISVSSQGERIVCDPWVGKANASGWQSFPEFSDTALREHLADVRWVYLSHLHDDHFHPDTLKSCGLLDREFIIKRFQSPVFRERLKRLGVTRIHEVDPFTVQKFGPFELSTFPQMTSNSSGLKDDINYDLDTSIAIRAEGVVFFNQVDNPLSLKDLSHISDYLVENFGTIDVACIKSGAASEYPHLFLGIDQATEKRRIIEQSLHALGEWLRVLRPKYYFPAGGTYLIPGRLGVFNHNIAQPDFDEISLFLIASGLPVEAFSLEGGGFLELSSRHKSAITGIDLSPTLADRQEAIEFHRSDPYMYDSLAAPDWASLLLLLDSARDNWARKVTKDNLTINQSIRFEIYSQLKICGKKPDSSHHLGGYQLFQSIHASSGELLIYIDHRALFGCITRELVWNSVLGALCLHERVPNRHYPTDYFSINFFAVTKK